MKEPMTPERCASLAVFYDGACPLCQREIALYRDLPASEPVEFVDVSDPAQPAPAGLQDFTCVTPTAVSKVGLVRF